MIDQDPKQPPRFVVGIDLGTTNCAVAYVDSEARPWAVRTFALPQLVAPATVEARDTLPSFHLEPAACTTDAAAVRLPWAQAAPDHIVGVFAREEGAGLPGRLVVSAKSWLSHAGVDRTAPLLPWRGEPDVRQLSPMEITARYLGHIRAAWDHAHPEQPLAEQDVVLTVPASFDEIARELTVEAARHAGLPRVVLLEEPQAAFLAWLDDARRQETERPTAGALILVLDVGGGTSDFTLIEARSAERGAIRFHRIAVGDHLILGGDNLDLALAHHLEHRLVPDGRLTPQQWGVLVRRCQQAKEVLLGPEPPPQVSIFLPGSGARLLAGALRVELEREEAWAVLLEGFLPRAALTDEPQRQAGLQELGLPYAADPAISRYLARFLRRHGKDGVAARPDVVLFNGGFFAAALLRTRTLEVLGSWFGDAEGWTPQVLRNPRLDLAVAHGAAYHGMVRRGEGEGVEAGLAHTYYIGVEHAAASEPSALCLVPAGLREGQAITLDQRTFDLAVRQPVEFPIYISSTRTTDRPGDLVTIDPNQLTALPPIRTVLRSGKKATAMTVPVHLHARLSEIGTLELWCGEVEGQRRWRLHFDVRAAVETDAVRHEGLAEQAGVVDEGVVEACTAAIRQVFGPDGRKANPARLVKVLEADAEMNRHAWPPSLLRPLWQALLDHERGRHSSVAHEARWLNLLGFALRPGYGYAVDDWRVAQTWRLSHGGVIHGRNEACRAEWWVLWRRIAGGLSSGQQRTLADPLVAGLKAKQAGGKRALKAGKHEMAEIWRLFGALEALGTERRKWLGEAALSALEAKSLRTASGAPLWALARLGARVPAYGPLNAVVPAETAEAWLDRLLALPGTSNDLFFTAMQLARRTDDRYRDISPAHRQRVLAWLETHKAADDHCRLVRDGGALAADAQRQVLGDSLPKGLVIRS